MPHPILLVDDSPSIRMLMRTVLEREHYQVLEAVDGQDALTKLDGQPLALILSDINMPRMDGIDFLHHVRQLPRYKSTPVLMLTTETRPDVKQAARAEGAQGFLNKPCTPAQLLAAVQRLAP
jgi:two-component system chemotaxis response regulator CheY